MRLRTPLRSVSTMKDELNRRFAITNHISFEEGAGGLPRACLVSKSGSTAEIYLYGATVTSWAVPDFGELLFLSRRADLTGGSAIRGGIPIIFPQFSKGNNSLPSHGFARISNWHVVSTSISSEGEVSLTLGLSDSEALRAVWPHPFRAELSVTLGKTLGMTFSCTNTGSTEISFHMAYHTYFSVDDISTCSVSGLKGLRYLDTTNQRTEHLEEGEAIRFSGEIDRIYREAPTLVSLNAPARGLSISIEKEGLSDAVVWNPSVERSRAIADLDDGDYRSFVCVEAGTVVSPIVLASGESWQGSQILRISR